MPDFKVDVRGDLRSAMADLSRVREAVTDKAVYRALNRALDRSATEASREIRKEYNVRNRAVLNAMKKARANKGNLHARLKIEGARIGLIEFDARWRQGQAGGATVLVKLRGGRKIVPGAFIATTGGGQRGVFKRTGAKRFPIRYLTSLSISQAFSNEQVLEAVKDATRKAFVQAFDQQLKFLTGVSSG